MTGSWAGLVVCWVAQEHEQPDGLPALAPKRRVPGFVGVELGRGHYQPTYSYLPAYTYVMLVYNTLRNC